MKRGNGGKLSFLMIQIQESWKRKQKLSSSALKALSKFIANAIISMKNKKNPPKQSKQSWLVFTLNVIRARPTDMDSEKRDRQIRPQEEQVQLIIPHLIWYICMVVIAMQICEWGPLSNQGRLFFGQRMNFFFNFHYHGRAFKLLLGVAVHARFEQVVVVVGGGGVGGHHTQAGNGRWRRRRRRPGWPQRWGWRL